MQDLQLFRARDGLTLRSQADPMSTDVDGTWRARDAAQVNRRHSSPESNVPQRLSSARPSQTRPSQTHWWLHECHVPPTLQPIAASLPPRPKPLAMHTNWSFLLLSITDQQNRGAKKVATARQTPTRIERKQMRQICLSQLQGGSPIAAFVLLSR